MRSSGSECSTQRQLGTLHQLSAQAQVAGAQRRQGEGFVVRIHRAAAVLVGRQLQHALHVGQRLGRALQVGQADHAVDAEHAEQACVVQGLAARQTFLQVAQGLVVVTQLDQLMRQVAIQHDIETMALGGAGLAQRLVHVGKGLLRLAQLGVTPRDGVQQHAELLAPEDAQALVAQRQHARQRGAEFAVAPGAARQPDLGQRWPEGSRTTRKQRCASTSSRTASASCGVAYQIM